MHPALALALGIIIGLIIYKVFIADKEKFRLTNSPRQESTRVGSIPPMLIAPDHNPMPPMR
jgi:hypothetical protein